MSEFQYNNEETDVEYISTNEEVTCQLCGKPAYGPGEERTSKQVLEGGERRAKVCVTVDGIFVHTSDQMLTFVEGDTVTFEEIGDVSDLRHMEDGEVPVCVDGQDVVVRPTEFEVVKRLD